MANVSVRGDGDLILLDDGAEASVFCNKELLNDVSDCNGDEPTLHTAERESSMTVFGKGVFMGVEVWLSKSAGINILSKEDTAKCFKLYLLEGWGTRAVHIDSGIVLDFCLMGKTMWADVNNPVKMDDREFIERYKAQSARQMDELFDYDSQKRVNVVTVADRARIFTAAERKRAESARTLVQNSGYRGLGTVIKSISRFTNCKVTAQDFHNQAYIYGATANQVKGRTVWEQPRVLKRDGAAPMMVKRDVKLLMDPMVMLEERFLIGVVKPLSLGLISHVKGVSAKQLKAGIVAQVNTCHAFRLKPTELVIDPERGLRVAAQSTGIDVTEVGPGDHVPEAENMILLLKNIARPTVQSLPYAMPRSMVRALGMYAMRRRNIFHTTATGEIPMEAATGVKVDARELDIGFGNHVEVRVRHKRKSMTSRMDERTRSAVALYPFGKYGMWKVLFTDTWTEGDSSRPILINMDNAFIEKMNARCRAEKPGDNYMTQLGMMCEAPPVETERMEGPAVVEAAPPDLVGVPGGCAEDPDDGHVNQNLDDGHVNQNLDDDDVIEPPRGNEVDHHLVDNAGRVQVLRSGSEYKINFLSRKGKHVCLIASMKQGATKSSLSKAMRTKGAKADKAMESAIAEVKQIDGKGSWHPVKKSDLTREERRAIVRTFMFVIDKFTPDGALLKVKARLVAMGNMQDPNGISMETSASTVDITSVLMMAAINAHEGRHKMTCDIGGAFLHTVWPKAEGRQIVHLDKVNARILVQLRPDYKPYIQEDGTILMELHRALYGLIQAARLWYNRLTAVLNKRGYKANHADPCVWNDGEGTGQSTVLFHVDDLSCSSTDLEKLKALEAVLVSEFGQEHIKCVYGDRQEYLGMLFEYTDDKRVKVSMKGYLQAILDYSGVDQKKTAKTPAASHLFSLKEEAPKLSTERAKLFHSLVQALSYAAQRVRWDFLLAVSFLKGRVSSPDEFDWSKLERLLHYLNGTTDLAVYLGVRGELEVDSSIDASHAVYMDARSQGGLGISLGFGLVKGRSHRLSLNTKSSAESELVTTSDNVPEVIHARSFLEGQGYKMGPSRVRQDNQAAIRLLEKGKSDSKRTKHINTRFFFVHDRIEKGELVLHYTPTELMMADFFIKPLQGNLFIRMRDKLLGAVAFSEGCE